VNGFTVGAALRWMVGDAALYTLLALYLLETLPQEYGVPLAWHFPLSPAYWAPLAYGPPGRSLASAWRALLRLHLPGLSEFQQKIGRLEQAAYQQFQASVGEEFARLQETVKT
jgi:hypothetical protein